MKIFFYPKNLVVLAAAAMMATGAVAPTQGQPVPSTAGDSALPADIVPGTPLAEVVKMVQAGVDVGTINTYILNSQNAFNLDADKIIFLKDEGVPTDLINAMMARDKTLYASTVTPATGTGERGHQRSRQRAAADGSERQLFRRTRSRLMVRGWTWIVMAAAGGRRR